MECLYRSLRPLQQVIKNVETEVTQLWKTFEKSPKKLAAYLKVQEEMKNPWCQSK